MKSILPFLEKLKANNNREWFQANKKEYEKAKQEFSAFVDELIQELQKNEPSLEGLTSKDCLFRINRDIRFSADKSPYKTNFGAVIAPGGRKSKFACYYLQLAPGDSFVAGGIYMPENDALKNIRQEIDYNLKDFQSILKEPGVKKHFPDIDRNHSLKTAPKGYDTENEAIDFLKLKSFTFSKKMEMTDLDDPKFKKEILSCFEGISHLNKFLNRALEVSE